MNLQQTVQALEQNNIQIALDIGVHSNCSIDSNCPIAVELRKLIRESGITVEQLLEGFAASQETPPDPLVQNNGHLPEFNSKLTIQIAGKDIEFELNDVIAENLRYAIDRKLREVKQLGNNITQIGNSLYDIYLRQVHRLRNAKTLPQLEFSLRDITKAGCMITTDGDNYIFLFPREYNPQWIWSRNIRYKLSDKDIKTIKRDMIVEYVISRDSKILQVRVLNSDGEKMTHYHGRHGDCWGGFKLPERWDKRLQSLSDLTTQIVASLATINKDSPMERQPPGMPHIDELMGRATELGEEGVPSPVEEVAHPEEEGTAPRRWGGRR